MSKVKFRWVGLNKKYKTIKVQDELTIDKILNKKYDSFFAICNRGLLGNCEFLSEDLFSGLKDVNGIDIYENDIVKWSVEMEVYKEPENVEKVVFRDGIFWPVCFPSQSCFYGVDKPVFEKVGNIYENSEMVSV